jgi:putative transposase
MMQLEGSIAIGRACDLTQVSRASFYRSFQERAPRQADMVLRDAIHRVCLSTRLYGHRRVRGQLALEGIHVDKDRVLRLMREDNLLCLRKRKYVLTTDSRHGFVVYPNLAADLVLTGVNQLWVSDITYIRLLEDFVYLAVVLDAFSRRVVGWELDDNLHAILALRALGRAIATRQPPPGLVHHSDQGVQYCCTDYVARLQDHNFRISMSRRGNPFDNAKAESFMKTLKSEEVYLTKYRDFGHAQASIAHFIEDVYNGERLHSALKYKSPAAFEQSLPQGAENENDAQ